MEAREAAFMAWRLEAETEDDGNIKSRFLCQKIGQMQDGKPLVSTTFIMYLQVMSIPF